MVEKKLFNIEIETKKLKGIFNVATTLGRELKLKVGKDGLNYQMVDPANVCMLKVEIPKSDFDVFEVADLELGVDLGKVNDMLKIVTDKKIGMTYLPDQNRLLFTFGNLKRMIGLFDHASISDVKFPVLDFSAEITMMSSDVKLGVKSAGDLSDHAAFIATKKDFSIFGSGDVDESNLCIPKSLLGNLKLKSGDRFESKFAIDYLNMIFKYAEDDVNINMGADMPMCVDFGIGDKGKATFLCAPRIESD